MVGAGIVGVTTAHALCAAGLRVCVIDRHSHVAAETSWVSSGQLEPVRVDHMRAYSDPAALGVRGLFRIATGFPRWTINYLLYALRCRLVDGGRYRAVYATCPRWRTSRQHFSSVISFVGTAWSRDDS